MDIPIKNQIIDKVKLYKGNAQFDGDRRADVENYYMTQLNYERVICNIDAVNHIVNNNYVSL